MKFKSSLNLGCATMLLSLSIAASNPTEYEDSMMNDLLLEKAIPLDEYEAKHIASGGEPFRHKLKLDEPSQEDQPEFMNMFTNVKRKLSWSWWSETNDSSSSSKYYSSSSTNDDNSYYNVDDGNDDNATNYEEDAYYAEEEADEGDDHDDDYFNKDEMNSFQGYSLKYATCQKVQRFSVDAITRGEYSSMVSDDIVVLRLCPSKSCSAYAQYGCSSGYGEYALTASDYMTIVMKYQAAKTESFCKFCNSCAGYYDDNTFATYNSNTCYTYSNECQSALSSCGSGDDDGVANNIYTQYLDYMNCEKVDYNDNGVYYWVAPYCDSSSKVSMGIYYDNYCEQYAGNEVNVAKYLNHDTEVFAEAQEIECLDCSESNYPPYYGAHNLLCNNIYRNSGQCDALLAYDLGNKNYDDDASVQAYYQSEKMQEETQCSFIESIRYGTYDAYGEIYVSSSQEINQTASVTTGQKFGLFFVSSVCISLALYSCYLHHSMTNLLLKSLSSGLMSKKKSGSGRYYESSKSSRPSSREKSSRYSSRQKQQSSRQKKSRRQEIEETFSDEYSASTADSSYAY